MLRLRIERWLSAALRHRQMEREMHEEMQRHLDLAADRLVRERGMSLAEARLAARREFGNVALLGEQSRDARGAGWVEGLRGDVRYAMRSLLASPVFTLVAVLSLAIGVGANTAIFSLINAVMLRTLPVANPYELVQVRMVGEYFTNPVWEELRDRTKGMARYAVSGEQSFNLAEGGEARLVNGSYVNGDFFDALGVRPAEGRLLSAADDFRGCQAGAVISHGFWQSEFGGRRGVVGESLLLGGTHHRIIGVAGQGFTGVTVGQSSHVYLPICAASELDERSRWWLTILARRAEGTTVERLNAQLKTASPAILAAAVPQRFTDGMKREFTSRIIDAVPAPRGLSPLREQYGTALKALMAMVFVVLLISCANVANLLLARGAARRREVAIRVAIGASRLRLMRHSLTESVLLALLGGAAGLAIAIWSSAFLVRLMSGGDRQLLDIDSSLDSRVLAFTAGVSLLTTVICALLPAWRATAVDPQLAMRNGTRGGTDATVSAVGRVLVVAQCALALVLIIGAGLLTSTFRTLTSSPMGFDATGVVVMSADLRNAAATPLERTSLQRRVLDDIRSAPGVAAAAMAAMSPVGGSSWNDAIVVEGFTPRTPMDAVPWFNAVSEGYFLTLRSQIIEGRDFTDADVTGNSRVAIISRAARDRFFGGKSPVGKVYYPERMGTHGPAVTIVGVAETARYAELREEAQPIVYLPATAENWESPRVRFLIRGGTPAATIVAAKGVMARIDPRIVLRFTPLADQLHRSVRREQVVATLAAFFGAVALVLAMLGLYGVLAYSVARRRVEIGIRMALGAARARVVRLVLADVARLIAVGLVIGGAAALLSGRLVESMLFGVESRDPRIMAGGALMLIVAAGAAALLPAWRAASARPLDALRED